MATRKFDRALTLILAAFGLQQTSPNKPADRLLPPWNADLGRFALGNTRSVVPGKGVSEPTNPEEDMIDKNEDRDERDPHFGVPRRQCL